MDRRRLLKHKVRNGLQQLGLLGLLALLLGYLAWVVGGESFLWGTLLGLATPPLLAFLDRGIDRAPRWHTTGLWH